MSDFGDALSVSSSGLKAQATRLRHVSENIANADTPGYRRKQISFEDVRATGQVEVGRLSLDRRELAQIFDPAHPLADAQGMYAGSNVNLIVEIADAREAQRGYEANLKMFEQVRQMSSDLLDLLKQ